MNTLDKIRAGADVRWLKIFGALALHFGGGLLQKACVRTLLSQRSFHGINF